MIRYLADAALNHAIVAACLRREPAMDFLSAHQAGLQGHSDTEVLALAAAQHRILVTSDFRTIPGCFAQFLQTPGDCAGVFLVKQGTPVADVIDTLLLVWVASEAEDWKNRILEIPVNAL
jgi:hypothetical protein